MEDVSSERDGDAADGGSMVVRTARRLAERSLSAETGSYLGSESDLIAALGVSRPTLRQAARVVANNQLLSVRRGINGGFFASRPDAQHVIEAPALWLRLQSATLEDMIQASALIGPEAAACAAGCSDPALVDELRTFRRGIDAIDTEQESAAETVQREAVLSRLIGRMSGNPVLALFAAIVYAFGLLERDFRLYRGSPDRRSRWLELQRTYCDAILAGQGDAARRVGGQRTALIAGWLAEDRGRS